MGQVATGSVFDYAQEGAIAGAGEGVRGGAGADNGEDNECILCRGSCGSTVVMVSQLKGTLTGVSSGIFELCLGRRLEH